MTFDEIVSDVCERAGLTTTDAITRVGKRVNRGYRRVTADIGMTVTRRQWNSFTPTALTRDQTVSNCERVLSVKLPAMTDCLDEVTYDEMIVLIPTTGDPSKWAVKTMGATSVVLTFDSTLDSAPDMLVEVEQNLATLSGSQVPAFPESFHDILVFEALGDELRKKKDYVGAKDADAKAAELKAKLQYKTHAKGWLQIWQGKMTENQPLTSPTTSGGSSSGTGTVTHSVGGLTASQLVVGNGGADIKSLGAAGTTTQVLHGNASGVPAFSAVVEADQTLADVTTNDVTTGRHGYVPKAPNDTSKVLRGDGTWSSTLTGTFNVSTLAAAAALSVGTTLGVTGVATLSALLDISGASAGQIKFPAAQNASANVNTLDDYEEGSWTPVIGGISGTSGQTYSSQVGSYVKIGKLVFATFDTTLSAKGTITGVVQIQGLPFTCSATGTFAGAGGTMEFVTLATNWISVYVMPVSGTTAANVLGTAAAAANNTTGLVTADIANTTRLIGAVFYIASA